MRFALLLAAVSLPAIAAAQQSDSTVTLLGRVADGVDSGAVANATVNIVGSAYVVRTNGWGYFRIDGVHPGSRELVIRALGYARLTQSIDVVAGAKPERDFYMMRVPHVLSEMVVNGRAMRVPRGFEEIYRRGARGWGAFITREQIDSINPVDLKTMLATIPGVATNDYGVFFQRCPPSWPPQLWIDGQRVTRFKKMATPASYRIGGEDPDPYFFNELLTGILPTQVQAVEVYTSTSSTPAEFSDQSGCGVVAVWTKRGP